VGLVVLDPLMSAISDTLDTHVNRQVRQALDPLARLADRTGVVIGGIAHFNKSTGTDASSLITASGAFKDVARFIFAFATDDDGSQVITQTKNSLGRSGLPSLSYRIIEAVVPTTKGDARVGRFVLDGVSERSVEDILRDQASDSADGGEKTRAEDYLRKALAGGPRPSKAVEEEAREAHSISTRTLKRARADLRIPAAKRDGGWWISLPEHEGDLRNLDNPSDDVPAPPAKSAKGARGSSPGHVGPLGPLDDVQAAAEELFPLPDGLGPVDAVAKVTEYVTRFPGCTALDLRRCGGGTSSKIEQGRREALARGLIHIVRDGRAKRHYPGPAPANGEQR
jgi:hypothetical protein